MSDTVIISLAPVAADCPRVIPEELAQEILTSVEHGAPVVHLHVRDKQGRLTSDTTDFQVTIDRIMRHPNLTIQASTGGVSSMSIAERCAPLVYPGVEMASLDVGSANLGGAMYFNPGLDVEYCSRQITERNIIPEFEVFEIGMTNNILNLEDKIEFQEPMLFNIVLGYRGSTPATIDALIALCSMVSRDALWGITYSGRRDFDIIAAAVATGASEVRIGYEDSYYLSAEERAQHNYQQVAKLTTLIHSMDKKIATPEIARRMLSIPPRQQ